MIHLDTNYLIGLLVQGSPQAIEVDGWLAAGEPLATSAIARTEFLNGPVAALEVTRAGAVLQSRIVPFGPAEATLAADLSTRQAGGEVRALTVLSLRLPFSHRLQSPPPTSPTSNLSCHTDSRSLSRLRRRRLLPQEHPFPESRINYADPKLQVHVRYSR